MSKLMLQIGQFILTTENNSLLKMLKYGGKGFFSDSPLFSRRSDSPQESKAVTYPARWTRQSLAEPGNTTEGVEQILSRLSPRIFLAGRTRQTHPGLIITKELRRRQQRLQHTGLSVGQQATDIPDIGHTCICDGLVMGEHLMSEWG